jgi:PKD domain/Bacterial Ig domain
MAVVKSCAKLLWSAVLAASLVACGGGGGGEPSSKAPTGAVITTVGTTGNSLPVAAVDLGTSAQLVNDTLRVSLGNKLEVDASGSTDPDGDPLTFKWQVVSKPVGSKAEIFTSGAKSSFTPDLQGMYQFTVTVSDGKGGAVSQQVEFMADNTPPNAVTVIQVDPQTPAPQELSRAVTLGSMVNLDASSSTDADQDPLTTTWTLTTRPTTSKVALAVTSGAASRFQPDVLGIYKVQASTKDPKGAVSLTNITINVNNRAPEGLMSIYAAPTATQSTSSFTTSEGYQVLLNGGPSTDADGDLLTYAWQLVEKPADSNLGVVGANGQTLAIIPDVKGTYKLKLTVTDTQGAKGENLLTLVVNNRRPVANIATNATPIAQAYAPTARVPSGIEVFLRGSDSFDADGDSLTYSWDIALRPPQSLAGLSAYDTANVRFTPDMDGSYQFKLRVTDPKGAYSERFVEIVVGGATPVVYLDRQRVMATLGEAVALASTHSFGSSSALTYTWNLDTKPQGSSVKLPTPGTDKLSFTPDVVGTYIVNLSVSNGSRSASTSTIVVVEKDWTGLYSLDFRPADAVYNRVQDLLVLTTTSPTVALKIVDPISKSTATVGLPKTVNTFAVSPDGLYAAVAHDALVSYIDLKKGALIRTVSVAKSASSIFLTNDGIAYLAGSYGGGQWNDSVVIDLANANVLTNTADAIYWATNSFYGAVQGVMADKKNRFYVVDSGISPNDIHYLEYNPVSHKYVRGGDSPYHGDYAMGSVLWLNEDQSIVFTNAGTTFNADTLTYAGRIDDIAGATSISQSLAASELLVTINGSEASNYYYSSPLYLPSYRRLVGAYYSRVADVSLPLVDGKQSYAMKVFHSAAGKHIVLVQVGSNVPGAAASTYHVIYR